MISPNLCMDNMMGVQEEEPNNNSPDFTGTSTMSLPKKKSGIFGASSNLVNSIVGAGIIGIPYALQQSGLVAGVLLLVLVAYLTDKSLRMIVELASFHPKLKNRGVMTYEDLMSYPFGKWGSYFVLFNMFILAYGAMVAYLLIIKDTIPTILGIAHGTDGSFWEREMIMLATSLIVVLPLSLQRDMASLSFTSVISVLADIILVVFIAAYAPIKSNVSDAGGFGKVLQEDWLNPTIFIGLGILSTAMACQHSAFIVSGSLVNKTQSRWATVTFRSLFISTVLCAVLGICGYLGFLEATEGDVLNNFPSDTIESNGARSLLAITMFFTYPMECFVARHVIVKLMYGGDLDGPIDENGNPKKEFFCFSRRFAVTIGIYVVTLIPALIVDDLGPVLSITGSLGGSMLSYMAPGMVYLGVNGEHFMEWTNNMLDTHRSKRGKKLDSDGIELPVAGDANQQMQASQASSSNPNVYAESSKPWWWFPALMPIWCALAMTGRQAMKEKLDDHEVTEFHVTVTAEEENESATMHPTTRDYLVSIFFIVFGVIGMIAGLGSNIYVQVNNTFFSPH